MRRRRWRVERRLIAFGAFLDVPLSAVLPVWRARSLLSLHFSDMT
jgi:hypothetical protein